MSEPIKWLYWDITQARYVDDDDAENYLISNPDNTLIEAHVEQSNPLPSGAGVELIPEKYPALMRSDYILYELCTSGNNLLLTSSGNNLVEGFLPLSGGTLTGDLILDHHPIQDLEASTKQYVDDLVGTVQLSGSIFVKSLSDLPDPISGVITLDPGISYIFSGLVNISGNRILFSENSALMGLNELNDALFSDTSEALITATGQNVIIRSMQINSPSGIALDLSGPPEISAYIDNCRFIGCKDLGMLSGFEFIFINRCVFKSSTQSTTISGLKFSGTNNHTVIINNEFEDLPTSGLAALTFKSDYSTDFAVINQNSFDITNEGIGIEAEVEFIGDRIVIRDNDFEGTTIPLSGIQPKSVGYEIKGNTEVKDSNIKGGYSLISSAETVISSSDTPVKVSGTTEGYDFLERFEHIDNNRLSYTGIRTIDAIVVFSVSITGPNNTTFSLYAAKNGNIITTSRTIIRLTVGSDQRTGTGSTILSLSPGDYIELWMENNTNTQNVTVEDMQMVAKQ